MASCFISVLQGPNGRAEGVERVAVRTTDFRLSYRVLALLRRLERSVVVLEVDESPPSDVRVVLCAPGEDGHAVRIECLEEDVLMALRPVAFTEGARTLVVAVDPGPRPGLVWSIDGREAGQAQLEHPDQVADVVRSLLDAHPLLSLDIRVGDGAAAPRNRILRSCMIEGWQVKLVDEHRSSRGLTRHDHIGAARRLLRMRARPLQELPPDPHWKGMVREIKRRSREWTGGKFTLPSHLALLVATGDLSMDEAVRLLEEE